MGVPRNWLFGLARADGTKYPEALGDRILEANDKPMVTYKEILTVGKLCIWWPLIKPDEGQEASKTVDELLPFLGTQNIQEALIPVKLHDPCRSFLGQDSTFPSPFQAHSDPFS